ncbi:MAG: hypothetical protein WC876_00785 [Candidatus Thermoplasmatota archaeon]|jgi:hypothetical protein
MRLLAALATLVLVAGCSSPEQPDPQISSSTTGAATTTTTSATPAAPAVVTPVLPSLEFTSCRNQGGVFSIPRAAALEVLPDGFEPQEATSATSPPDSVVLYAIAVHCEASIVDGVAGSAFDFAYAELAVTPSQAYAIDGIDDCTVPLAFIATDAVVGAALADYGLGVAGAGSLDETAAQAEGTGSDLKSFKLGGASLEFIVGEASADTLTVGEGAFVLYGVQDRQVVSLLKGTAQGGSAHYAPALFQSAGIPALADAAGGAVGFGATGFNLRFEPLALPAMV